MNKKLLASAIAITLSLPTVSNAATLSNKTLTKPTVAILDTAINSSLPAFQGKIIYEACVTEYGSCPGNTFQSEGPGSAALADKFITKNGFDHGTMMVSTAIQTNLDVNIVFVRIIGNDKNGFRQNAGEKTVYNALDWVIKNKDRFNIQSVAMSQGMHPAGTAADYCPKTPITQDKIKQLNGSNIGVFFPAGNGRDYVKIDWPSCIPEAIAIGATMPTGEIAIYSNNDNLLIDFYTLGTRRVMLPSGAMYNLAGTSAANITAAVNWATIRTEKPTLSYQQVYDLISKTSKPTKNSKVLLGKSINITGALNG